MGTCVEPIGPEHSVEEIAEKILIGREMNPCYSGVARRISIPGSALEKFGMISEYRMAYLSGSSALLADMIHGFSDTLASLLVLAGILAFQKKIRGFSLWSL